MSYKANLLVRTGILRMKCFISGFFKYFNIMLDVLQTADYLSDFYFLTDPEEFVYDHLPEDITWQLLASPVSKLEFQVCTILYPTYSYILHRI